MPVNKKHKACAKHCTGTLDLKSVGVFGRAVSRFGTDGVLPIGPIALPA